MEKSFIKKALLNKKSNYMINIKRMEAKGKISGNVADLEMCDLLIKKMEKTK